MNALPSTEFRKTFARLTERTIVTVNGHVIGSWTPAAVLVDGSEEGSLRARQELPDPTKFNSRPFTPAPKPSQKGK
jgi:hypothetical protein